VDYNAGTKREMEALQCIVALLLALAGLAERAAGRSFLVRWLIMSYLRHAQNISRDCFVGPSSIAVSCGHMPADAIDLAASFRALALVVRNIAARLSWQSAARASDMISRDGTHQRPFKSLCGAGFLALGALDTS